MKPEKTIDFHIRKAWQKILRMYNIEAAKHGSTMSVGYILLNIDKEGTPSTQLGPKVGIEKSSLSRTLKWMEEQPLISGEKARDAGRVIRISLTEWGQKNRHISREAVIRFDEKVREKIPAEKLALFVEVISQITDIAMGEEEGEKQTSWKGQGQ